MKTLMQQYRLIEEARHVLFEQMEPIPFKKLHQPVELYNGRSVCYLLMHVSANYQNWINGFALKNPVLLSDETTWQSMQDVKASFKEADKCMFNFLAEYTQDNTKITGYLPQKEENLTVSVLQLYTAVITYEFHQTGILIAMIKELGYSITTELDIIRF